LAALGLPARLVLPTVEISPVAIDMALFYLSYYHGV
jgi:hypothetical protein